MRKKRSSMHLGDKAAARIAGAMLYMQKRFAKVMNECFSKLNSVKRKLAVLFFSMIGGGLSLYYIYEAIIGVGKENPVEAVGHIQIPVHNNQHEKESIGDALVDDISWKKVHAFKIYLDSLKNKHDPEWDNIRINRPGLMDSIDALEQIYYSQKIK